VLIDLDARDLITLEHDKGDLVQRLDAVLRANDARLVLSFVGVNELAGASRRGVGDGFMRLLLQLEEMPHTWIRTVDIPEMEVERALNCFAGADTYRAPQPYALSYLDTWGASDEDRVRYQGRSLAEIMWDQLYAERQVGPLRLTTLAFAELTALDREEIRRLNAREYRAELKKALTRKVRRIAAGLIGEDGPVDLDAFADAVWAHPDWCEGTRLQFEVQHVLERDRQTDPTSSDPMDLTRIMHVPYVDGFTCDNSKREYLNQLARGRNSRLGACGYWAKVNIDRDVDSVIERLK
jgi:hypothetical protein